MLKKCLYHYQDYIELTQKSRCSENDLENKSYLRSANENISIKGPNQSSILLKVFIHHYLFNFNTKINN